MGKKNTFVYTAATAFHSQFLQSTMSNGLNLASVKNHLVLNDTGRFNIKQTIWS